MGAFQDEIRASAPLSVAEFMARCNAQYYGTRDPLGPKGDFTTAPEISQIFGEVIGAFVAHLARGQPVNLIEGGPGRGTLMADMLRATRTAPGFHEGLSVHLVETSPALMAVQKTTLGGIKPPLSWAPSISDLRLENNYNVFIFNELFDALPSEQFVRDGSVWRRRRLAYRERGWMFEAGEIVDLPDTYEGWDDDVLELSPARTDMMAQVCDRIAGTGGAAVIIDYGPMRWGVGDTLQAIKDHNKINVLEHIGDADLTTHVDFGALADVARAKGLYVHPLITQGAFLNRLGGAVRAQKLGREADYARLADADQMGELFKVLIVAHPDWEVRVQEVLP